MIFIDLFNNNPDYQVNITEHELVPEHVVMNAEEKAELLARFV